MKAEFHTYKKKKFSMESEDSSSTTSSVGSNPKDSKQVLKAATREGSNIPPSERDITPLKPALQIKTVCDNCKAKSVRNFLRVWYLCKECSYGVERAMTPKELADEKQ